MLLGAALGGALAGCSTAAVPYGADEAGVVPQGGSAPSAMAVPSTGRSTGAPSDGGMPASAGPANTRPASPGPASTGPASAGPANTRPAKESGSATVTGTVLAAVREIPVGGGKIFSAERVVVTQPARGQYRAFSAVCTHVGCILSEVANGTIDCPCHGAEFKITNGAVVTGPAPSPLPPKQIKIVNGQVVLT